MDEVQQVAASLGIIPALGDEQLRPSLSALLYPSPVSPSCYPSLVTKTTRHRTHHPYSLSPVPNRTASLPIVTSHTVLETARQNTGTSTARIQ